MVAKKQSIHEAIAAEVLSEVINHKMNKTNKIDK